MAEIKEFIVNLLKQPPGPPHSVQLEVDTGGDVCALFEVLLLTMTEILKNWYPPPITIGQISDEDVLRLVNYFASFGIKFALDIQREPRGVIRNRDYLKESRLEDMTFQMSHLAKRYTVRFSNL